MRLLLQKLRVSLQVEQRKLLELKHPPPPSAPSVKTPCREVLGSAKCQAAVTLFMLLVSSHGFSTEAPARTATQTSRFRCLARPSKLREKPK
ncbi:UNVERIFIED_CONTAM: hypothetical protein HHA_461990 [Hammondia hammondi]|eukprot:XP_008883695.1 hypothetical protein HHA_461990 [Hammondia hammondi]